MEQMYLVEIFVDKVTVFFSGEDEKSAATKSLITKIKFGPKVEFIIKEDQLAHNNNKKEDIVECDDLGRRKWTRTIRTGKSYLFPSYPDTVLMMLSKFPLEIEVWNDDEKEIEIFVGLGTMIWDTQFFHMLKETADTCKIHEPLAIKQVVPLFAECCCKQCGEISFILRLTALGEAIITEFQQLLNDPEKFVFRTNKAPSMFECKRIESDNPNFVMVGSLYETTTLEDPTLSSNTDKRIEVCTDLQSCGNIHDDTDNGNFGPFEDNKKSQKSYPIDKIRMGDITGPCGNTNCPLAHKVKMYIRNLDTYKSQAEGKYLGSKGKGQPKKICGTCDCKDDRWHREECPENLEKKGKQGTVVCSGCGGTSQAGETCDERQQKMYGTGVTPRQSPTKIAYVTEVTNYKDSIFGPKYMEDYNVCTVEQKTLKQGCCCSQTKGSQQYNLQEKSTNFNLNSMTLKNAVSDVGFLQNPFIYNVQVNNSNRNFDIYNCTIYPDDKDCKCNPPKPTPPCRTFDCDCIEEIGNVAARKAHKAYCPLYKHKSNCPVTMMNEDELAKKPEDDDEETEALPYGLPPIKLGPCPVLGRPCTVPDGFARMYKTAAIPPQPPSYSDAGKVCCSKEYERIKKAIKDYMKYEKDDDFRCVNKFIVDTETRCCDKEQRLFSLMGKACCGSHKLAIQNKYKDENNNN